MVFELTYAAVRGISRHQHAQRELVFGVGGVLLVERGGVEGFRVQPATEVDALDADVVEVPAGVQGRK